MIYTSNYIEQGTTCQQLAIQMVEDPRQKTEYHGFFHPIRVEVVKVSLDLTGKILILIKED